MTKIASIDRYKAEGEERAYGLLDDIRKAFESSGVLSVCIIAETGDGEVLSGSFKSPDTDVWRLLGILRSLEVELLLDLDRSIGNKISRISCEGE